MEFLSDHPGLASAVAAWVWKSWGYPTRADCEDELRRRQRDGIPIGYVALGEGEPLGVVNLIQCNLPTRPHLSPWLAGLYVHPPHRGRGVGEALVRFLEDHAASLGFRGLYLYTQNAEGFYGRLGWRTIERTEWEGRPVAIMTKPLLTAGAQSGE